MRLELRTDLTIAHAAELKGELSAALREDGDVTLDGRRVVAVDLAGLQLLVAAQRSAIAEGKRLDFEPGCRSEAIDAAAEAGGFRRDLWEETNHG